MNDIDFNKKLLEACDSCASSESTESHTYSKSIRGDTGSVTVSANAESMEELKMLLGKVGITLPKDKEEVGHDHDHSPCDDSEEPMKIVKIDVDGEQEPQVNPYNSGQPDKQVLTNIIRDKLKDYLRNSQS